MSGMELPKEALDIIATALVRVTVILIGLSAVGFAVVALASGAARLRNAWRRRHPAPALDETPAETGETRRAA
jgi:hypothetical protein